MKTKILVLIAGAAIVTLSFSFASGNRKPIVTKSSEKEASYDAPIGGLASEDKF